MRIKSITIQGMHKISDTKTYDMKDFTYLFGKNGAGKSTVMQAIQLAILGYIPGTDKNKTAILGHANGNGMSVTVTFDNGMSIVRSWVKSGANITADARWTNGADPEKIVADTELPIFDFSEFIGLSANKLKDWFVNFFPTNNYSVDWNTELSNAVLQLNADSNVISDMAAHITEDYGTDINSVRKFNEECKAIISSKKGELTRVQSTIQSLIHYDDCDPMLDEITLKSNISAAEIVVDNLKAKLTKYEQYEKAKATIADVECIIKNYADINDNPKYIEVCSNISNMQKSISIANNTIARLQDDSAVLRSNINANQKIIDNQGVCPITQKKCSEIQTMIDSLLTDVESDTKTLNAYSGKNKAMHIQLQNFQDELAAYMREKANIENAYQKYQAIIDIYDKSFDGISKDSILQELNAKNTELAALRERLVQVQANAKYEALMETLTADKIRIELDIELYKAWEKLTSINGLQTKLMNQPFADFSTKMTKYIQKFYDREDISAGFCLVEKANSFSFGLIRDGKYIPYDLLSSGEKCMYMLSLILTINDESKSEFKIVLVDDLLDHLDAENIYNTFITLYNSTSSQIIIAGVQPYTYENADDIVLNIGD